MWDECNCAVVWAFFGIAFLWDWNENWPFPVLWPLLCFPDLLGYRVQHLHSIIFQDYPRGFPSGSDVKNPPRMQETWVWSLGWEDPLEEGSSPSPVFSAGESHGQRDLAGYDPWDRKESDTTEQLNWTESNCAVVCTFFGIAFLWDWNENWPFPVLWQLLSFANLLAYLVQHFHSIIF